MTRPQRPAPWWKGHRGEGYVFIQAVLLAVLLLGPRGAPWFDPTGLARPAGIGLIAAGALFALAGAFRLGRNLTPLPHPRDDGELVTGGAYGWVRHPIYCGLILAALGWALAVQGLLTLLWAAVLLVFFDIKSRREETWLRARFPAYADYQRQVKKLIPFVY